MHRAIKKEGNTMLVIVIPPIIPNNIVNMKRFTNLTSLVLQYGKLSYSKHH